MNRNQMRQVFGGLLFHFLVLPSHAVSNQVFSTTGDGAVLTAPWVCGQTALRDFTVLAWVSVDATTASTERVIVERVVPIPPGNPMAYPAGSRLNFQLGIDRQGHPFGRYHGGGFDPIIFEVVSAPVKGSQWTHLAVRCESQYLRIYENGQLVCSNRVDALPFNGWFASFWCSPGTITIGTGNADPTGMTTNLNAFFSGKIDEISVWNAALSDSDIGTWMNRKPIGSESNLVAYWCFDDGSASDASTNGINGSFCNSTSSVERIAFPTTLGIHASTNVTIQFQTVQDALYAVETSTSLLGSNWVSFVTNVLGTGDAYVVPDLNSHTAVYYRVLSL